MVQKYIQPYCLTKYVKLYIGVCCDFEYGTSVPSCGLLFYEQFSTVLKPIMTLVAEISARWRCQHTFPDSGRTTFSRFLTALFLQYYLSSPRAKRASPKGPIAKNGFSSQNPARWPENGPLNGHLPGAWGQFFSEYRQVGYPERRNDMP